MNAALATITLRKRLHCWTADFAGTPSAEEFRGLFGTTEIPTPFSAGANPIDVALHISNRNPLCRVVVEKVSE